jgi:hypothetical protein
MQSPPPGNGAGLGPHFRLNLSGVSKTPSASPPDAPADQPPARSLLKPEIAKAATLQAAKPAEAARGSTTLARKNLVLDDDESSGDDLLELIPVGEDEGGAAEQMPDVIVAPSIAISHLPDLQDADDDDDELPGSGEGGRLALLQEMLLPQDLADEPPDVWTYQSFIKHFRRSEASTDLADSAEEDEENSDPAEDEDSEESLVL